MISEAKLREIEDRHRLGPAGEEVRLLTTSLRQAAEIIEKMNELHVWYPSAHEWLRVWRGESEKQGEAIK